MKEKTKLWIWILGFLFIFILAPMIAWAAEGYNFIKMWPVLPQPRYFSHPLGIGVDFQGKVFVADTFNHRIQKLDNNGNFISQWGSQGGGDGLIQIGII